MSTATAEKKIQRPLTIDEVATILDLAPKTVYDLVAKEKIKGIRIGGRKFVTRAELERVVSEGTDRKERK